MAKIENYIPSVARFGLTTDKAATFGSTLAVTGAITSSSMVGTTGAFSGEVTAASGTSVTAGGADAINIGAADAVKIIFGSGVPSLAAPKGSLYLRTDGSSASTRMYVNTDGSTTWTSVTTAA